MRRRVGSPPIPGSRSHGGAPGGAATIVLTNVKGGAAWICLFVDRAFLARRLPATRNDSGRIRSSSVVTTSEVTPTLSIDEATGVEAPLRPPFHVERARAWSYVNRFTGLQRATATASTRTTVSVAWPAAHQPGHHQPVLREPLIRRPRPVRHRAPGRRDYGRARQPRGEGDQPDRPPSLRCVHHGYDGQAVADGSARARRLSSRATRFTYENCYFQGPLRGLAPERLRRGSRTWSITAHHCAHGWTSFDASSPFPKAATAGQVLSPTWARSTATSTT